jgi:branched-chain amino acid transport system substrate-binding protein
MKPWTLYKLRLPALALIALAMIIGLTLAACSKEAGSPSSTSSAASSGPVSIGFFAPESGYGASDGSAAYIAAKLAVSDINKAGGVNGQQVALVNYDDATDPKQAVTVATRLVNEDKVNIAVSGGYGDSAAAVAPIFQRAQTPFFAAYAQSSKIVPTGDFCFQGDTPVEGRVAAVALGDPQYLGAKKVAVVAIKNEAGDVLVNGFLEQAKKLGMQVVAVDYNQFGEKEFAPIIQRDLAKGAQGFFMAQYYTEAVQFMDAWNSLAVKLPLVGTELNDSTEGFWKILGAKANGMVTVTPYDRDNTSPDATAFATEFTQAAGYAPDMVSACTYAGFMEIAAAMKANGTSPTQIRDGLVALKDFPGVGGTLLRFDNRVAVKTMALQIVKDGQLHSYGEVTDPAVITP